MHRLCLLLLLVGTTLACNELENLVNKERRKNGLRALHCDPNMRWVARKHIVDQEQGAPKNWPMGSECSLHSWFVRNPCCYKRDHSNMQCMHNKPLVRIFFLSPSEKLLMQKWSRALSLSKSMSCFVFTAYFRSCLVGTRGEVLKYLLGTHET